MLVNGIVYIYCWDLEMNWVLREFIEPFELSNWDVWGDFWGGVVKREPGVMYMYIMIVYEPI